MDIITVINLLCFYTGSLYEFSPLVFWVVLIGSLLGIYLVYCKIYYMFPHERTLSYDEIRSLNCMVPTWAQCGKVYRPFEETVHERYAAYNVDDVTDIIYLN